jgi:hypothetical protein
VPRRSQCKKAHSLSATNARTDAMGYTSGGCIAQNAQFAPSTCQEFAVQTSEFNS